MMTLLKRVYSLQAALPAVPPAAVWSAAQRAGSTDLNCAAEERGDEEPGEGTPSWYIILGAAVLSLIAVIVPIIVGGIILCRRGTKNGVVASAHGQIAAVIQDEADVQGNTV